MKLQLNQRYGLREFYVHTHLTNPTLGFSTGMDSASIHGVSDMASFRRRGTVGAIALVTDNRPEDRHSFTQPQKKLAFAVLLQSLRDLYPRAYGSRFQKEINRANARAWFLSDDQEWQFSFLNICEIWDLSPSLVRRWIQRPSLARRLKYHLYLASRPTNVFDIEGRLQVRRDWNAKYR